MSKCSSLRALAGVAGALVLAAGVTPAGAQTSADPRTGTGSPPVTITAPATITQPAPPVTITAPVTTTPPPAIAPPAADPTSVSGASAGPGMRTARASEAFTRPAGEPAITRRDTGIDESGSYRSELQACRDGRSQEDLQTCLKEARNAQAARRRGDLGPAGSPDYRANALARCERLASDERAACEARVLGLGNSSGSVAGGGVLRWVETVVIPPGQDQVTYAPQTADPVVVLPAPPR